MKVLKCRTCKKELTGRDKTRAEKHRLLLCAPCYREYYNNYREKKKSKMPWYDDWILKESLPIQKKGKKE